MSKRLVLISVFVMLLLSFQSCKKDPIAIVPHVSGYWEIEKVVSIDGDVREYGVNLVIDYFSVDKNLKGFRKKLSPNLDGTYSTSENSEQIALRTEDNNLYIKYTTAYDSWEETIVDANKETMVIVNDAGSTYIYKRYESLDLFE